MLFLLLGLRFQLLPKFLLNTLFELNLLLLILDLNLLYFGLQYQYQSHLKIIYPHYEFRNLSALNFICSADSSPET